MNAYLIGFALALGVSLLARLARFDKDRAFYPTVTIVIATYYALFAVMGGATEALLSESLVIVVFIVLSVSGFRRSLWLVVVALFAHGIFDFFHGHLISNPGVPAWWPRFCMAYDVTAAGFLAWLLCNRPVPKPRTALAG